MRRVCFLLTIVALTFSCRSFETEEYLREEDKALVDLIPEMADADDMLALNDFGTRKPILYIIEDLDNYLDLNDHDSISDQDREGLAPLIKNQMERRKMSKNISSQIPELDVKLLSVKEYESKHKENLNEYIHKGGTFGYLGISRIVFVDKYKSGYVSFYLFCGEGCLQQAKDFEDTFKNAKIKSPTLEIGTSYSWATFSITFWTKEDLEFAESNGLVEQFKKRIKGYYDKEFDPDRAVYCTYVGHVPAWKAMVDEMVNKVNPDKE